MRKISVIQKLTEMLLGRKYYGVVVGQRGAGLYFLNGTFYRTREEAAAYRRSLDANASYMYIETVSFRSRNDFLLTVANGMRS